jgi:hypothetical protein
MTNDSRKTEPPRRTEKSSEPPDEHTPEMIESLGTSSTTAWQYWLRHSRRLAEPKRQSRGRAWQLERLGEVVSIVFPPEGRVPAELKLKAVQDRIAPEYEKRNWTLPGTDSIARFLGRRKRSD